MDVVRLKLKAGVNTPSHYAYMMHKYQGTIHIFKYWYWKHQFKKWLKATAEDMWVTIEKRKQKYENNEECD